MRTPNAGCSKYLDGAKLRSRIESSGGKSYLGFVIFNTSEKRVDVMEADRAAK